MSKILVTGATGAVGPCVVTALQAAGYSVRILAHRTLAPATPGIEVVQGDITDPPSLALATQGVDAVVHIAALLHIVNPNAALHRRYEAINVEGTANIVTAALAANVRRLIFFSSIAVYGPTQGHVLDETSPPAPDTIYGSTKLLAEQIVLAARREDGTSLGTVLRLGAVYGARIKGNYLRLVRALAHNRFLPVGKGENHRTLVYDKDAARAVLLAVQHPVAAGRVYNVTDGEVHTIHEINLAICAALGRRPPRLYLPATPLRTAVGLIEDAARLLRRQSPIGRTTIDKYTQDVKVDAHRIQIELGFQPAYNLSSGWTDAIQEMRQQGAL